MERQTSSALAASAAALEISRITRYLELSDWCEAQHAGRGSASAAVEADQDLDRDMGFSQITESGFIYAFDEPVVVVVDGGMGGCAASVLLIGSYSAYRTCPVTSVIRAPMARRTVSSRFEAEPLRRSSSS